jgi:hypothetical protein
MSIWGVARPGQLPTIVGTVGAADVTLTSSTAVTGFTPAAALIAPFQGGWAYYVNVFATIVLGGTAPSALVVTLNSGVPGVLDTLTVPPVNLVNSAILALAFTLVGPADSALYWPTGDTPTIKFNGTGQASTLKAGSRAVFGFVSVGT